MKINWDYTPNIFFLHMVNATKYDLCTFCGPQPVLPCSLCMREQRYHFLLTRNNPMLPFGLNDSGKDQALRVPIMSPS